MRTLRLLPTSLAAVVLFASPAYADETATNAPTKSAKPEEEQAPQEAPKKAEEKDEISAKNAVFLELLGNGLFYSINYDRRILDMLSVRVGLMYLSLKSSDPTESVSGKASVYLVPIMANFLFGGRNHKFELGIGPSIAHASASASVFGAESSGSYTTVYGTSAIGYRYSPADGGFFFRVGVAPSYFKGVTLPLPALSLGGVF